MSALAFEDRVPLVGASTAAGLTLATLLLTMRARVDGGTGSDRIAQLAKVYETWPSQGTLTLPSASISDATETDEAIEATFIEPSFIDSLRAALMEQEVGGTFEVDLWCADPVERHAFMAAVPALFRAPGEGGSSRILPMASAGIPRPWSDRAEDLGIGVRLVLTRQPRAVDDDAAVHSGEWRASFSVEWAALVLSAEDVRQIDAVVVQNIGTPEPPPCAEP